MAYETRKVRHRLALTTVMHTAFIREGIDMLPDGP